MSIDPLPFHHAAASYRDRQNIFADFIRQLVSQPFLPDLVWIEGKVDSASFTFLGREWKLTHTAILGWGHESLVTFWVRGTDLSKPEQFHKIDEVVMDRHGNVISRDVNRPSMCFQRHASTILLYFINTALKK